jgi:hypothetical protein
MVRKKIILLFTTFIFGMAHPLYALDTGINNLEMWGYVQNEIAWHTTENDGISSLYQDRYVSPLLGFHPAAFAINGLLKQNKNKHPGSLMKFENTFNLKALYRLIPGKLEVFARIYMLFDSVYEMEDDIGWHRSGLPGRHAGSKSGDPRHRYRDDFHNQPFKRILREFYIDYHSTDLEVRVGKQMIVWGEIDGFRLLDLVNPFDLREFILDDYEDSRIPQWSIDVKWRFWPGKPNKSLEFVFIPDFEDNYFMEEGSQWEVDELKVFHGGVNAFNWFDGLLGPLYDFKLKHKKPGSSLENFNYGIRYKDILQTKLGALAYTFSYYYAMDSSFTPFVKAWSPLFGFGSTNGKSPFGLPGFLNAPTFVELEHTRLHIFGATFNYTLGYWQLRGELAYTLNKFTGVNPLETGRSGQDMARKKDTIDYCLGFDRSIFTDWLISGQIIQNIVINADSHMVKGLSLRDRRAIDTHFTLVVQKLFNNDQMTIQSLFAYGTEGEWWISPLFKWEFTQNATFSLGAQVFEGNHYDTLGQFDRNDLIFTRLRYSF